MNEAKQWKSMAVVNVTCEPIPHRTIDYKFMEKKVESEKNGQSNCGAFLTYSVDVVHKCSPLNQMWSLASWEFKASWKNPQNQQKQIP